ncbi:unnamed protein product [Chironomus riparius]|uniref:Protein sleepless n=1 Tax=Chironomus riparius TaxID=315576 RepID=A0A9N9RLE4_9DIPT|nr:unnamed protein product [Chironomus riparius]
MNKLLLSLIFCSISIYSVTSIKCYVCNSTDTSQPFQCSEWFERYDRPDIQPVDCSAVHGAKYCIKHIGRFEGGIGAIRYCSSRDLGNYCNDVKNKGDELEYRSCIFTCETDGCNTSSFIKIPLGLLLTMSETTKTKSEMHQNNNNNNSSIQLNSLTRQNLVNSSKSSTQVLNSSSASSSSSRIAKTTSSQRLHHITSSSSTSSTQSQTISSGNVGSVVVNPHVLQRDLNEFKNSMSEINNLASRSTMTNIQNKIRSSLENLVDDSEPVVTFPDENKVNELHSDLTSDENLENTRLSLVDRMKYEEKRTMNTSKTKFLSNGFSSEQAMTNAAEMKKLQTNDLEFKEAKAITAVKNRFEMDGLKTEEANAVVQVS